VAFRGEPGSFFVSAPDFPLKPLAVLLKWGKRGLTGEKVHWSASQKSYDI